MHIHSTPLGALTCLFLSQAALLAQDPPHWKVAPTPLMGWNWGSLDASFDLAAAWQASGIGGPGRWPDGDMIPLGRIGIRAPDGNRQTRFTRDEQVTMMSLFAMMPSPLMLGMNLPDNDEWTTGLITNKEMLAINQDSLGQPAKRIVQNGKTEIWLRDLADGAKAVAFFNRGDADAVGSLTPLVQTLQGKWKARDVWQGKGLGDLSATKELSIPKHGSVLLKLKRES